MSEEEVREHAERIIAQYNSDYEFCLVYEDYELEEASPEDQIRVHDAMQEAKIQLSWS